MFIALLSSFLLYSIMVIQSYIIIEIKYTKILNIDLN